MSPNIKIKCNEIWWTTPQYRANISKHLVTADLTTNVREYEKVMQHLLAVNKLGMLHLRLATTEESLAICSYICRNEDLHSS